jgi:predicted 2-oxoglutarate/Fe(II)-dependent dioxygenase YbiX
MSQLSIPPYEELRTGILSLAALGRSYCDSLVEKLSRYEWMSSTIAEVRGFSVIEYAREDIRSSLSIGEPSAKALMDELLEVVRQPTLEVFKRYWGIDNLRIKTPQFTKYNKGHFIKSHTDNGAAYPNRVGSVVAYLNDDYLGGEIAFPKFSLQIRPTAGTTLIFPSEYIHEVRTIVEGTKHIFLFFLEVTHSLNL